MAGRQVVSFRLTIRNVNLKKMINELTETMGFRLTIRNVNEVYSKMTAPYLYGFRLTIRNVNWGIYQGGFQLM